MQNADQMMLVVVHLSLAGSRTDVACWMSCRCRLLDVMQMSLAGWRADVACWMSCRFRLLEVVQMLFACRIHKSREK